MQLLQKAQKGENDPAKSYLKKGRKLKPVILLQKEVETRIHNLDPAKYIYTLKVRLCNYFKTK